MENQITTKGMMIDILSQRNFAKQLVGEGKDYDDVLNWLLAKDYYYDEDLPYPSIKELTEDLNISYSVARRLISCIYNELSEVYRNKIDYSIPEVEYIFYLTFLGNWAYVKLKNIPAPPRVGEDIVIPFFKEKIQTDHFYIRSVKHIFTDKKQEVYIHLVVGQFNLYWNMLRDEKYAKCQMSRDEYDSKDESTMREKYGLRWL
ncbi:hypothetical protein [Draconibacterium orientale]|uniref:hypothetical protein n=1 Tax=Draconibacterium orientale TaxID=1168034 RepID=UPI002A0A95A9|nr:hypothetical protein [Draconibacterium orientale]